MAQQNRSRSKNPSLFIIDGLQILRGASSRNKKPILDEEDGFSASVYNSVSE
jgi:hypothetical protein